MPLHQASKFAEAGTTIIVAMLGKAGILTGDAMIHAQESGIGVATAV